VQPDTASTTRACTTRATWFRRPQPAKHPEGHRVKHDLCDTRDSHGSHNPDGRAFRATLTSFGCMLMESPRT